MGWIQAIGEKLVCTYRRGTAHTIGEDARAVYARTSVDRGKTWTAETTVANTLGYGEVTVGKGLDSTGAMLLWVRRIGKSWNHDLYRTITGRQVGTHTNPKVAAPASTNRRTARPCPPFPRRPPVGYRYLRERQPSRTGSTPPPGSRAVLGGE